MEIIIPKSKIEYIKLNRDVTIRFNNGRLTLWANGKDMSSQYKELKSKFKDSLSEFLELKLNHNDYELESKNYD